MANISENSLKKGQSISIPKFTQEHTVYAASFQQKKISDFISRLFITLFSDFFSAIETLRVTYEETKTADRNTCNL